MFELVRSIELADDRATGIAAIAADHPMLLDHFPGRPIVPGTWLVELAAQIAGPLAEQVTRARHGVERWAVLVMVGHAKFFGPVGLPVELHVEATLVRSEPASATVHTIAHRGDSAAPVMRGELMFALIDAPAGSEAAIHARHERLARWQSAR